MKIIYLTQPTSRLGEVIPFKDIQDGEYCVLTQNPRGYRAWYREDGITYESQPLYSHAIKAPYWFITYGKGETNHDFSAMIIVDEDYIISLGCLPYESHLLRDADE